MTTRANRRNVSASGKFVLDLNYVRRQIRIAIRSFFSPLDGVFDVDRGMRTGRNRRPGA